MIVFNCVSLEMMSYNRCQNTTSCTQTLVYSAAVNGTSTRFTHLLITFLRFLLVLKLHP